MTLQQLRYIIGVSEIGSLNKASEQLYIAQPSLTASIKEVENEIGFEIFNRGAKGMTLTSDGVEFVQYARQVYSQYENLVEKFSGGKIKKKFGVSTQHYSFAIKAFVEMVKKFDKNEYEFAIRETKTREVIDDVASQKSEIGILYLSDFNRKALTKIFNSLDLQFTPLINCETFVYIWKKHPLAKLKSINFKQLQDYPNLSFEQGESGSFYFAEEILCEKKYFQTIKVNDRATMLNLMTGLLGYTLCSGIICEELNGSDYVAVPFKDEEVGSNGKMEIGWISKKNLVLSQTGEEYINELKKYFEKPAKNTSIKKSSYVHTKGLEKKTPFVRRKRGA